MATQDSGPIILTPGEVLGKAEPVMGGDVSSWPEDPAEVPMAMWDSGVFITELINLNLSPKKIQIAKLGEREQEDFNANPEALLAIVSVPPQLKEGTYRGTQLALTKMYELVESNYKSYMDAANFEPTVPSPLPVEKKREFFSFTCPNLEDPLADNFPPHLNLAANKDWSKRAESSKETIDSNQNAFLKPTDLFNKMRVAQLAQLLPALIPDTFLGHVEAALGVAAANLKFGAIGRPDAGKTIHDVEQYQRKERGKKYIWQKNDIFNLPNVGDLPDWYSDERFAQQFFTGTNPTTIEPASDFWIQHFLSASQPEDQKMRAKIEKLSQEARGSLYMQDYSYFREAAGIPPSEVISCEYEYVEEDKKVKGTRYGVAAVCLFHLNEENGKLAPLAIVCDWRGSKDNSVTIYNQEPPRSTSEQAVDWPWRYAKTCVQTSDWLRHEVTVHLTNTHLIEEATIVGAQRSFPDTHMVFQLLYPHWQKTLALNAAARATLVPHVINELLPFTKDQSTLFTLHAFNSFDFKGRYAPEDLRRRGFPPETLDQPRSRNYAWARCIHSMWGKIRRYVAGMLDLAYPGPDADQKVAADGCVRDWSEIMQKDPSPAGDGGAGLKSFPTIRTLDQLIDAVTMCIHLASPQHTSINYLQNYYQAFVINKPPCLYRPPPTSLAELRAFKEKQLVLTLPINHPKEWLLASHISYLLSFKPGDKESLISYACSKYQVYMGKRRDKSKNAPEIATVARRFYNELRASEAEFKRYGQDTFDAGVITYDVLSPSWNAVSILI
ncbi:hypothetical protein MMC26_002556 [Xylographa opegraphella]|nr:hypothetical protein [Xylographa opegraphella]